MDAGCDIFSNVPLAYITALQFAYHDIAYPVKLDAYWDGFPSLRPPGPRAWANLRSGALSLGSVYGGTGLQGDVFPGLDSNFRWPVDRAKLWIDTPGYANRIGPDILRLHRVIYGGYAIFSESQLGHLPSHLKRGLYRKGDLAGNRAIIPEMRNDMSLLLSQFHCAVARFHAREVDHLDDDDGSPTDRQAVFEAARNATLSSFRAAVVDDVLPRLCDPKILAWCRERKAPVHESMVRRDNCEPHTVPLEAVVIFEGLFDLSEPSRLFPNRLSLCKHCALQHDQMYAGPDAIALPDALFVSPRVPTRLAHSSTVDWGLFLDHELPSQTLLDLGRFTRPVSRLDSFKDAKVATGQAWIRHLRAEFGLDLQPVCQSGLPQSPKRPATEHGDAESTPLFDYVIAEAKHLGTHSRLGPLGSLIVAETLIGAGAGARGPATANNLANFLGVAECPNRARCTGVSRV